jgi:putative DNA primase/helicase
MTSAIEPSLLIEVVALLRAGERRGRISACLAKQGMMPAEIRTAIDEAQREVEAETVATPTVQTEPSISSFEAIARRSMARGENRILPIEVGDGESDIGKNPAIRWSKSHADVDSRIDSYSTEEWAAVAEDWVTALSVKFPKHNACVVAKPYEFLFIDEDESARFRNGYEAFAGEPFPVTFTTSAREDRWQSHWRQTDRTREMGNIGQDKIGGSIASIRQNNLYVLAEGSRHKNGFDIYKTVVDAPIISMPDKLVDYIESLRVGKTTTNGVTEEVERNTEGLVPHGSCHGWLLTQVGRLRNLGFSGKALEDALIYLAKKNLAHPIDFEKVKKMARSADVSFSEGRPTDLVLNQASTVAAGEGVLAPVVRRMNEYGKKKVYWLWQDRIPYGFLCTLAGDPDEGKSLITLYVAARVSRGERLYDNIEDTDPAEVLILSAEDDPESTLRPRLEASGADLSKIYLFESVALTDGQGKTTAERIAQLDSDISMIEKVLDENPAIKLIIVDPISSFLGAGMNKEQEVRRVLQPLAKRARENGLAVVMVAHFNKNSETRSAMDRVGGAKAIVGMGRSAWTCVREPKKEPKEGEPIPLEDSDRRFFLKLKNNLAPSKIGGLVYTIRTELVEVEGKNGPEMVEQPYIVWIEKTDSTAQEIVIGDGSGKTPKPTKAEMAKDWLRGCLESAGGHANVELIRSLAKDRGFFGGTLDRAKHLLGLEQGWVGRESHWALKGRKPKPVPLPVPIDEAPKAPKRRGRPRKLTFETKDTLQLTN